MTDEVFPKKSGALRGVKAVEFGHYVAAPFLGMLLADQGATVIKVEPPHGDPYRTEPAFAIWNRGKNSVFLDLACAEGRDHARALTESADIVIENFRPGRADHLGIGYNDVASYNRSVIYCSLPGYSRGSPHRPRPGWDPIILAQTGVHQRSVRDSRPHYNSLPFPSMFAAIIAAGAVTAALFVRHKTGVGQHIEVPLHSAMVAVTGRYLAKPFEADMPEELFLPALPMRGRYRCSDGRYVQNHGSYSRFVHIFLTVAGRPEWIEDAIAAQRDGLTAEDAAMWRRRFEEIFLERDAKEWENVISAAGGACCMVRSSDEWLELPHAHEVGAIVEVDDPHYGRMKQPGIGVRLAATPGSIAAPASQLKRQPAGNTSTSGQTADPRHSDAAPTRRALPSNKAQSGWTAPPLSGIRVLDLCIVVAGPTCGRALAELGADVIKIDDPSRKESPTIALDVNRGKRSLLLDLKTAEGKEIFWRMVQDADVIIENYRAGKLEALGLGYEHIRRRKPDIIYASLNALGYGGEYSMRPGWETIAQAISGMQLRRGGKYGPMTQTYPFNDYGSGLLLAYGILLALYERELSGRGQSVWTSLATTASLLQSRHLYAFPGCRRFDLEGPAKRGECALSRLYKTASGWLYLHALADKHWCALTSLAPFSNLAADPRFATADERASNDWELSDCLAQIFARHSREYWLELLIDADIPAGEKLTLFDIAKDPALRAAGLLLERHHPGIGLVQHAGPVAQLSQTPLRVGRPSPRWGADSKEILLELGYSQADIRSLEQSRIVVCASAQKRSGAPKSELHAPDAQVRDLCA
jgi:crotonobetainyl-CoA:carnitine CoA-transferase CaiB-like acyl-CoA transferase